MSGYFMFYYVVFAVTIIWIQGIPFEHTRDNADEHVDYVGDDYDAYDDDDYSSAGEEDNTGKNVTLISPPLQDVFVNHGDTVNLECQVNNKKQAVIQWKDSMFPLFMDDSVLHKSDRASVHNPDDTTSVLKIKNIEKDETFECTVLKKPPLTVRFNVKIIVPPMITSLEGSSVVEKGSNIRLKCEATGVPPPKISWLVESNLGNNKLEGESFVKVNAQRHDRGKYTCVADNGKSQAARKSLDIAIKFPPEMHFEVLESDSGDKMSAELICTVHSYPEVSKVEFKKNDKMIGSNNGFHVTKNGAKYIIKIEQLKATDFGNYVCIATYNNEVHEKSVYISETPKKPELVSLKKNENGNHVATWQTSSFSRIVAYEIIYKPQENNQSDTKIIEVDGGMQGNKYTFSYEFKSLPRGTYEVKARVKNEKGWSKNSDLSSIPGDINNGYNLDALQSTLLEAVESSAVDTFSQLRISLGFVIVLIISRYVV